MEDISTADGFPPCACLMVYIIDFDDFHRFHVAIFRQADRHRGDLTPPVRGSSQFGYFTQNHNEVWLASTPFYTVIKYQWHRCIGDVTLGRTATCPGGDYREIRIAEGGVILVTLNADILLYVPGRHGTGAVTQGCLVFNKPGKGGDFFIGHQGHGTCTTYAVAILATALQNWFDVFVEGDVAGLGHKPGGCH